MAETRRTVPTDISQLPPELSVAIISQVQNGVSEIPYVSKAWRALFDKNAPTEVAFKQATKQKFGTKKKPHWARKEKGALSWGRVFLALSQESCHLCPNQDILYGAFAASSAFSMLTPDAPLMLFPICKKCMGNGSLVSDPETPIVIDLEVLPDLFAHVTRSDITDAKENIKTMCGMTYTSFSSRPGRRGNVAKPNAEMEGKAHAKPRQTLHEVSLSVMRLDEVLRRWPNPCTPTSDPPPIHRLV